MRSKNLLALATVVVFATSCGESSTKETGTAETVSTADTKMPDIVPVKMTVVVPEPAKLSFQEKYPTASNVSWNRYEPVSTFDWEWTGWSTMDTADYMVTYKVDANDYWSWYDNENNWVGTITTITDYAGLPAEVNKSIASNFPGYTIVSVDKENDKNRTAYELELTKGEDRMKALIAENGTVLKKKGIVSGEKVKEKSL
jgi:hypothetical protein